MGGCVLFWAIPSCTQELQISDVEMELILKNAFKSIIGDFQVNLG